MRDRGAVHVVPTLTDLISALRSTSCLPDIVVVPQRDVDDREAPNAVREIAALFPQVAVIAYCRPDLESSSQIRALAMAGVHQFLFSGEDTRATVRAVLDSARRECASEQVLAALNRVLPPKIHPLAESCLARPGEIRTVQQLASARGLHRKTLYNQCINAGAPSPAELIAWCRLGLVAYLLTHSGRTLEALANELEFPSPNALRNMIKRYTGLRAGQIRESGGVDCVARSLLERVSDLRPKLHVV
jgi:AraC-like DNA-binding protein